MPLFHKPRYSTVTVKKKDIPQGLWKKCPVSGEIIYNKDLEKNQNVVLSSGYHFPVSARERLRHLLDAGSFEERDAGLEPVDPLDFSDLKPYKERLDRYQKNTGLKDAVVSGEGRIGGIPLSIAVFEFQFGGGSMGSVAGEKVARAVERAIELEIPCVIVSASGGARMMEGILSLMQMAKTASALGRLAQAGLPYISILTNPTAGGVTASFATLGDLILAEPGAFVCFAGPRVIKETTKEELPEGFQSAEFLLERGLIDQIVPRTELRERLRYFLSTFYLKKRPKTA